MRKRQTIYVLKKKLCNLQKMEGNGPRPHPKKDGRKSAYLMSEKEDKVVLVY